MVVTIVAIWSASRTTLLVMCQRKSMLSLTGAKGGGFTLFSLCSTKSTTIWGMATSRPRAVMSLASGVAVRWCR